jgi:nucleotide-binding universal stress UspA family protein
MKNILLPTDFSKNSWNAISYALRFFENAKCNFYLLHISAPNYLLYNDESLILNQNDVAELYTKPSKRKLRELLFQISKLSINRKNHNFYTLIEQNFFIEGIRKTVDEKQIDFIVMGTKGSSGLERIILGTNTANVITKVKCNTLAVPENAKFTTIKEVAYPTDFTLSHDLHVLEPISNILENFNSYLRIIHIIKNKTKLNNDQQRNKELLEDFFDSKQYSFHYLTNKNIEDAIQCFVESRDINIICMVAKNLNYFQQILFHSKVEEISYHTDIPFMVLHEKNKYYG